MNRRIFPALLALTLAACATPPPLTPVPVDLARASMLGQPPPSILACMGRPPISTTRGRVMLWSYPSALITTAIPVPSTDPSYASMDYTPFAADMTADEMEMNGPVPHSGCVVNVVFDSGVVRSVTYRGPGGRQLSQAPECTPLVYRCLR